MSDPARVAGILLHPTSLPGPWPVGDFGAPAEAFLDWAVASGFGLWQILPLGPSAAGNSPYSSLSTFALDPFLIAPEGLAEVGLLESADVERAAASSRASALGTKCDFGAAREHKAPLLRTAWQRFRQRSQKGGSHESLQVELSRAFDEFRAHPRRRVWLDDWCLFAALRSRHQGAGWWTWERSLARREPAALASARSELAEEIDFEAFLQFCAHRQWQALRTAAHDRGIQVLGDLPIYLALDSAEVWAHRDLFELDDDGRPLAVAGVPPDYFSEDGQLWGNPLFRWQRMAEQGYRFWVERLRGQLDLVDLVRLDHFRAFAGYWRVPAGAETARDGTWETGPGKPLFDAFREHLVQENGGRLPLIAEDLGEITDDVHELRKAVELPSMKVLHFGFDHAESIHAPHHLEADTLVYTGTHDNDTTVGWFHTLAEHDRQRVLDYVGGRPESIHRDLVRTVLTSVPRWAVVPMQDVLGLGTEARMNTPGVADGNWAWRLERLPSADDAAWVRRLVELSDRLPK